MKEIPFLLAGPILRRIDTSAINIWLATKENTDLNGSLYTVSKNDEDYHYTSIDTKTIQKTVQSGKHLYIHLLTIKPTKSELPTNHLIGYNIYFNDGERAFDLKDLNLLNNQNPNSIVYGKLKFPTFFIPKDKNSNILYGSCQKPHGKGDSAFISADFSLEKNHEILDERPHALFLLGDQIYADDIADPIFPVITSWRKNIIGENDSALMKVEPYLNQEPFVSSIDKVHSRQFASENFAKFTSGNADNHLFRFGEYVIMYLLTLGPSLWEGIDENNSLPSFQDLIDKDEFYIKYPPMKFKDYKKELKQHVERYEEERNEIIPYIKTLGKTRRLLANMPTYMIFDDHDITDDWNISYDWVQSVYQSSLGKYIVSNGLTAFLLFQGWGNDPDKYQDIINELSQYMDDYFVNGFFHDDWINRILQYHEWTFVTPTNPKSIFLDTRTMRSYDLQPKPIRIFNKVEEGKRAAQLIGEQGWKLINLTLEKSEWKKGDPLLIISPTPFYGVGIIESFLRHFVYPLRILGLPVQYDLDFEAWKYNGEGFTNFLRQITQWNPSQCVILSGDVHYASAVTSNVTYKQKQQIKIHQFTSSPINNMSFSGLWGRLMKTIVWFNSLHVQNRSLYRYCDNKYHIYLGQTSKKDNLIWEEEIAYLSSTNGATIETKNNIGLLKIGPNHISGGLLQYDGKNKQIDFK